MLLHATTDIIRVVTGSAADVEPNVFAMEVDNSVPPVVQDIPNLGPLASITTATTTTILDCTTANRRRKVRFISLYNNHASQSTTCRVEHSDGTNVSVLANATLLAGEMLLFDGAKWLHYDTNGALYPSVGNAATQADMEAGTATNKFVTPQGVNWHPGACKFWCNVTGGATPALQASWNVTSIADTGVGRMTVTIATDFSSANWCAQVAVFQNTTSADEGIANIDSKAAGTMEAGCRIATPVFADPPIGYDVCGFGDQ
jgi:hypothetical protein